MNRNWIRYLSPEDTRVRRENKKRDSFTETKTETNVSSMTCQKICPVPSEQPSFNMSSIRKLFGEPNHSPMLFSGAAANWRSISYSFEKTNMSVNMSKAMFFGQLSKTKKAATISGIIFDITRNETLLKTLFAKILQKKKKQVS